MVDASEYGKALLLLTDEQGTTESVLEDIAAVKAVISENPKYADLADTPAVPPAERTALIGEAFFGIDNDLLSLLKILCEKREFYRIGAIADAYRACYEESRNILNVTAVTAVAMSGKQIEKLQEKLALKTGKTVVVKNTVDESVLGGMKLRYAGVQLDGSLKANLDSLASALRELKV